MDPPPSSSRLARSGTLTRRDGRRGGSSVPSCRCTLTLWPPRDDAGLRALRSSSSIVLANADPEFSPSDRRGGCRALSSWRGGGAPLLWGPPPPPPPPPAPPRPPPPPPPPG